jgi:hypothetical protein
MERGPMALFGAIVAVGLGPAMWLGAQFGAIGATPSRPPAVSSELQPNAGASQQKGGEAGSAPEDPSVVLQTRPKANYRPLDSTPSPSRSASATTGTPDPDDSTTEPTKATTSPSPSDKPSTPPTESTSDPTDTPTEPPSPPSTDAGPVTPA